MQSDTPQGDPRLQAVSPGHTTVAVRCGEPCILYLETTLPGEIPLLGACWAHNSFEVRPPGKPAYVVLQGVTVIQNQPKRKKLWLFSLEHARSIFLIHSPSHRQLAKLAYVSTGFENAAEPVFQWALRPLDNETHLSLRRVQTDFPNDKKALTSAILRLANVDWQSIADALVSLEDTPFKKAVVPRPRHPSLVRRLITSVFKKKPKLTHA